jgi:hypothetical protein
VSAQPKFTTAEPEAVAPCSGVSIAPNGAVADALTTLMTFVASSVRFSVKSCAKIEEAERAVPVIRQHVRQRQIAPSPRDR